MLECFNANDVRGRVGAGLDAEVAHRIGRAFAAVTGAGRVVLARDARLSSPELAAALSAGMVAAGGEVHDLGLAGTEEMYFATAASGADGGVCVTASHNPAEYNGMKFVGAGSAPLGPEVWQAIAALAQSGAAGGLPAGGGRAGRIVDARAMRAAYVERIAGWVDVGRMRPLRVVVNCGNGVAGPTFAAIAAALSARGAPLSFRMLQEVPDGRFPNGVPNPLLAENRHVTEQAVREAGADLGVAFDGDFDRCFLFDETGAFVPSEYIVSLLAGAFLAREPGAVIVHDPRVVLATRAAIEAGGGAGGGRAVAARTGHAHMKRAMRETGAVYGGEMSGHHYFRDFHACDSGMIPWLMVADLLGRSGQGLSALVAGQRAAFPSSGEINFAVADAEAAIARVEAVYGPRALGCDRTDGVSFDFGAWRMNLRRSNTEPLVRLNVEARGRRDLVESAVTEVRALLEAGAR